MKKFSIGIVLAVLAALNGASAQDCSKARNATPQDIMKGESVALLNSMAAACKSQVPENFFRLQTSSAQQISARATDKAGLFKNYCEFTSEAIKTLGGGANAGVHTIGPHKNKMKCGAPASFWFIHTKDGTLALRLEVAVESGSLKIDTH
ncbi:hypothetical protein [Inhella crocodyli]|uniref:DUF4019 domain-containing protein n=1 Tax=Inhella crocodyli TaxID=2499851 RepID=A0A437LRB4_9BURK|nr:hypothetical protein [Inhella crocodyli]RVT87952.1 hypothetical protein EOD73_02760 [Inhella crocodyli]